MFPAASNDAGQCMTTGPIDACKTPTPGGPVPLPYPNIAMFTQADGGSCSDKVKIMNKKAFTKKSKISMTTGDEPGTAGGGVVSNKFKGSATPKQGCAKVKVEGEQIVHLTCMFGTNEGSPTNTVAVHTTPCQTKVLVAPAGAGGGGGGAGDPTQGPSVPDQTSPDCQNPTDKSESTSTASPEVKQWLDQNVPPQYHQGTLGAQGGGGFLAGATQVIEIAAGTPIVRYWGTAVSAAGAVVGSAAPGGSWWGPGPVADPVAELALPQENPGVKMARGVVKKDTKILAGPGAPRCSNKPGGPTQYFFPRPVSDHVDITDHGC